MCAHPRIDPATGEMLLFAYDVEAPFLIWAIVGPDGTVTSGPTAVPSVDEGFMIHDFTITPTFLVLVLGPVVFDLDAMMTGGDVLSWRPDLGTRIALVPRDGSDVTWIETDPFFVWHYGNAFDDGGDVVVDFSWWSSFSLGADPDRKGAFTQMRLSPGSGTAALTHLDDSMSEFARIDDRLCGQAHRYVTVSQKSGKQQGLLNGELDGWYLTYATDLAAQSSYLVVWDAQTFPSEPVAKVRMPHRVPNGLHGNWMPAEP